MSGKKGYCDWSVGDPWLQVEQGQKTFYGADIRERDKESCMDLCFRQMTGSVEEGNATAAVSGSKFTKAIC